MGLSCCSSDTPSSDADAARVADASAETRGVGGSGGASGAPGASGGMGGTGGAAAGAGSGGTTGGRGGSFDAGGTAGSSRGGQAGAAGRDPDASMDAADARHDAASSPDRNADTNLDGAADASDASDDAFDAIAPPSDAGPCSPLPTAGVYATFRVVSDVFRASITNPTGIDQALALWRGQSQAKIPTGQLECGEGTYNCGWSWRMTPASITFAEITIEVCDATPSYVQSNCASFPNGSYCPWSAELIELRDCRTQAACPVVPR
jgi:hypothetical protein